MKCMVLCLIGLLVGCSHGPVEEQALKKGIGVSPDRAYGAALIAYNQHQWPTGLAAFPNGGERKELVQRADLYIFELPSLNIVARHTVPAPPAHQEAFDVWFGGWRDDRVYFSVSGCASTARVRWKGCEQEQRGTTYYSASLEGVDVIERLPEGRLNEIALQSDARYPAIFWKDDELGILPRLLMQRPPGQRAVLQRAPVLRLEGGGLHRVAD